MRRLSGGNQQKVVMARALLARPRILICDEPTRGVDVQAKMEIYELLQKLAAEGVGILLISSEFSELLSLPHRILVVRHAASHLSSWRMKTNKSRPEALKRSPPIS